MTDWTGRVIWSLANSGIGTTIAAGGNSGSWTGASQTAQTPVDLRFIDDLEIMVSVAGITTAPSFVVGLGIFDDKGNLFKPSALALTAITAAGGYLLAVGRHAGTAGTYITLPDWGQVYWTCSGGTVTGVEIQLYGRG